VLATGSVKNQEEGDVETYAQWSKNRGSNEWKTGQLQCRESSGEVTPKWMSAEEMQKSQVTAFVMSPHCQAAGSGARVLREIKWLVAGDANGGPRLRSITAKNAALICGLTLSDSGTTIKPQGTDLNRQKDIVTGVHTRTPEEKIHDPAKSRSVLMAIRGQGKETYYQKRGFSTAWSGAVPVRI